MKESWQPSEEMLPSANSNDFADSLKENHDSSNVDHPNFTRKPNPNQKNIERNEKAQVDIVLDADLLRLEDMLGDEVREDEQIEIKTDNIEYKSQDQLTDKILVFNEELQVSGKSSEHILKSLIEKYKDRPEVATWVKNWKNFLRLHEFANTKSNKEQRIIQSFIAEADFSSASSFTKTLSKF